MGASKLIDAMLDVAKAAEPLIDTANPMMFAVVRSVINMVDAAIDENGITPASAALLTQRDALERKVNDHIERTVNALRGGA